MPFYKSIKINDTTSVFLWKITEDFNTLFRAVELNEKSQTRLNGMKSESHQKGFLSVRMLLQNIGYTDFDLYYDAFGKPHLMDGKHISISHSHEFSAIATSDAVVGVDLEKLKEKTLKIAPRFMDVAHLEKLNDEDKIKKATIIWGIKECVFKIINEMGISFPDHISETPFTLDDKKTKAQLYFNSRKVNFNMVFETVEDSVLVCGFETE